MVQSNEIFEAVVARLDLSEDAADWCDRCNEGHPDY